ncbi:hypothetical protein SK128_009689 [Halocaridina rubra]|uniref:SH3 domain-containing protein n=1 Tax=Halocaridina rubra TaxID=373956 RepID=A0AAN8WM60_HALRR
MTVEELESLAESEHNVNPKIQSRKEEERGGDPLKSLLTAAILKHTTKKRSKKNVKSSKNDVAQDTPQDDVDNIAEVDDRDEEQKSENSSKETHTRRSSTKESENHPHVLGITLHCCDRLEASPIVFPHPVVQVHICDSDSGRWLQKSANDRKVTSYYEGSNVDYILPIMTQPFDLRKNRSLCCQWQEQLIFNESKEHLASASSAVVIFFQLMDFPSPTSFSEISSKHSQNISKVQDWVTLAWAFLKLRGSNGHINIGQKLRLQLWRPRKSTVVTLTDLYSWWKSGSRIKYSSTLSVSLQEIVIPQNPRPALRSMLVTQREYGGELASDNMLADLSRGESESNPSVNVEESSVQWSRKLDQSCKIPNQVKHYLCHTDDGCMIVKFSNNGLKLACGAHKQILLYEVLSGKLEAIFSGHLGLIYDMCWSDNDQMLLSASGDSTARVWNMESADKWGSSQTVMHPSHVYTAKFVPLKSQVFVSGGYDHVIRVWLCDTSGAYVLVQELTNHLAYVNALCFNTEGDILYSGDKQGVILAWNVKIPKKAHSKRRTTILSLQNEVKITDIMGKIINSISYHPGGYRLLIHTRDSQLRFVNHKQWIVTHRLTGGLNVREQLRGCVSPCGTWVISGSEDYGIYIWHSDTGELLAAFLNLSIKGSISCVDFHPFDNMIAICSYASQTPVLILSHNPEKKPLSSNILTHINPDNSASLASSLIKGNFGTEDLNVHGKNMQNQLVPSVISSCRVQHGTQEPNQGSSRVNLNASNIMYIDESSAETGHCRDSKEMWQDVGRKILYDLDNILKMASEDPLGINTRDLSAEKNEIKPLGKLATVMYDYEASEPDELSVKQGDYVMIVKSENSDWWQVRTADMKSTGFVPANYLKHLPHEEHRDTCEKIIAIPSGSGAVSFIAEIKDTPSKARARRHRAKKESSQRKVVTSTVKNK